jgi:hypothetical protein
MLIRMHTRGYRGGRERGVEGEGSVDFNLVQYFTANKFSIKEHKRYNGKYTHYTKIFPLETQTGKTKTYSIFIHIIHYLQYNIHIGANGIQNPNPMTWISQQP